MAPGVAGIVWLKNKMIPFVKGFQFTTTSYSSTNLPLTGGTSSSNLVDFFGQTVCYVYGCICEDASGKNLYSTGE